MQLKAFEEVAARRHAPIHNLVTLARARWLDDGRQTHKWRWVIARAAAYCTM